jgi:hypothetical protein
MYVQCSMSSAVHKWQGKKRQLNLKYKLFDIYKIYTNAIKATFAYFCTDKFYVGYE